VSSPASSQVAVVDVNCQSWSSFALASFFVTWQSLQVNVSSPASWQVAVVDVNCQSWVHGLLPLSQVVNASPISPITAKINHNLFVCFFILNTPLLFYLYMKNRL
jgi:hypothetical protein